jgi:hypothetical protein
VEDESTSIGEEAVQKLQDHSQKPGGSGDLQGAAAQAAAGLILFNRYNG